MKNSNAAKRFAKPISMATALALAMSMSPVAAIAAPAGTTDVDASTVTITGLQAGDTVSAFQIADAYINANNTLGYDFVAGLPAEYDSYEDLVKVKSDGNTYAEGSAMQKAAAAIANVIVDSTDDAHATATGTSAELTLDSGYYLVRVTSTSGNTKVYQNMIVDVSPEANASGAYVSHDAQELAVKSTDVTVTKTVGEGNAESTDAYQVGDSVPFKIQTAIPNYPADSKNATFIISDKPTAGLSIETDTIAVAVKDATQGTDYTITSSSSGYTITFSKAFILANPGKSITVTYNATLTKDAFSLASGDVTGNTASVTFNPNPYSESTATPEDKTTVQTYGYVFNKTGKNDAPLEGAVFTLCDTNGNPVKDENGNNITSTSTIKDGKAYVYFSGLKAGSYKAKETTVPAGYAAVSDVEFSVSATDAKNDNPATSAEENNFKVNTTSIQDPENSPLPTTGGEGTLVVTIAGVAFIGAAAYLIVRSRRKGEER
jgi:fimbrial isopeptide formation D2 family protein/LPXTG-motif cell wall-anchored protein